MSKKRGVLIYVIGVLVILGIVVGLTGSCALFKKPREESKKVSEQPVGALPAQPLKEVRERYPEPLFPSYLKAPKTIEEAMPYARAAAVMNSGMNRLGLAKEGDTVLIVIPAASDDIIVQAIKRALEERGVKVQMVGTWEFQGLTREQQLVLDKSARWWTNEHGFTEGSWRIIDQSHDPEKMKLWLKLMRPDLHDVMYPETKETPAQQRARTEKEMQGVRDYLDRHPEVKYVFWRTGGDNRPRLKQHANKAGSHFHFYNRFELISKIPTYPADVSKLNEEKTIESLAFIDKAEVKDPQGTDFTFDVDKNMAELWSKGVYIPGHLFMFPTQATGRIPYSVIEYPKTTGEWLSPMQPKVNGVFAGTTNHRGFFPRIEVHVKDGYVKEVKGGGILGEIWSTFLNYPGINEAHYPYFERPGYWYLYEAGLGTNPKYYGYFGEGGPGVSSERQTAGVIHWGFGLEISQTDEGPMGSKAREDFIHKWGNQILRHSLHLHNVLPTYKVRIRGTEQWLTLIDKGRMTALDSPEVRALASRYGNPDDILKQEWVRHLPGINAPGSYEEYSADPWKFEKQFIAEIDAGTYRYFSK